MEILGVSTNAYTTAVAKVDEEEKLTKVQGEKRVEETEKDESDIVMVSKNDDFSESSVEEKASNYIQNLIATTLLTEESKNQIVNYLNNFDVQKFIKSYGPFSSNAEVSAALYAATSGMVKRQEED